MILWGLPLKVCLLYFLFLIPYSPIFWENRTFACLARKIWSWNSNYSISWEIIFLLYWFWFIFDLFILFKKMLIITFVKKMLCKYSIKVQNKITNENYFYVYIWLKNIIIFINKKYFYVEIIFVFKYFLYFKQ